MIIFLCTGIWHGAGLTFLLWGVWNGIFVAVQGFIEQKRGRKISPEGFSKFFGTVFTLLFVLLGFVIFKSENMGEALETYINMFTFRINKDVFGLFDLRMCAVSLLGIVMASPAAALISDKISKSSHSDIVKCACSVLLLIISTAILFAGSYNPFIYFRF